MYVQYFFYVVFNCLKTNNFHSGTVIIISHHLCPWWQLLWCLPYTGCPRRNVPDFGRVFLMLKYADITQNTYVQSWMVTEIMAREKCGLLAGPRTTCQLTSLIDVCPWVWCPMTESPLTLAYSRLIPECAFSRVTSVLAIHVSCIVLGTLRTTMTCVRVFL